MSMKQVLNSRTLTDRFAKARASASEIREAAAARNARYDRERKLDILFGQVSTEELKSAWDAVGDDSFGNGYDCADIHYELNRRGEGAYCVV